MQRWLVMVVLAPLVAATAANAQSTRLLDTREPAQPSRTINLRLIEEPGLTHVAPPSTGFIAETDISANARIGLRMMNVTRPKLGPEWRIDGRSSRVRKPALSFSWRF